MNETTKNITHSDVVLSTILDDKLDSSNGVTLLSVQTKLIKTLKEENENQRQT